MMKTKVILMTLVLAATTTIASAQVQTQEQSTQTAKRSCFVDADANGICDNFEDGTCTIGTGSGLMDGTGNRAGVRDGSGIGRRDGSGNIDGVRRGERGRGARGNRNTERPGRPRAGYRNQPAS